MTTHLQGVGDVAAVRAGVVKVGDVLMWNAGYKSEIVAILKETKAQIIFQTKSLQDGQLYERRMNKTSLVARV